jgi:Flp pilus assembly pilin Flp
MNVLRVLLFRLASERGQTLGEYVVLITWVALLVIVGATTLGHSISTAFTHAAGKV